MATLNPKRVFRQFFPTARRLLVELDINEYCADVYKSVLVIGAGYDPYRHRFPSAEFYVALDIILTPGVTTIVSDAQSLPFLEDQFDCVIAIEVFEHVENSLKMADEIYRVLMPGGKLILSAPFLFHEHGDPYDFNRPTRRGLEIFASKFNNLYVRSQGNRIHVLSDLITTAFYPYSIFAPLRIFNHLFVGKFIMNLFGKFNFRTSAPSGYFLVAKK